MKRSNEPLNLKKVSRKCTFSFHETFQYPPPKIGKSSTIQIERDHFIFLFESSFISHAYFYHIVMLQDLFHIICCCSFRKTRKTATHIEATTESEIPYVQSGAKGLRVFLPLDLLSFFLPPLYIARCRNVDLIANYFFQSVLFYFRCSRCRQVRQANCNIRPSDV